MVPKTLEARRRARGGSALGFCKFQAVTGYGGLPGLSNGNAVRRAVVMVDVARVAAFCALVLWTLRLAHDAIIDLSMCAGKPARTGHQDVRARI